jgi:hypothetical protein
MKIVEPQGMCISGKLSLKAESKLWIVGNF